MKLEGEKEVAVKHTSSKERDRSTMKLILSYLACEMQVTDERKAERILVSME